jgi:hypothetical protein
MVVTDGVFSMDGDIAPLKDIADLCDKYEYVCQTRIHTRTESGESAVCVTCTLRLQLVLKIFHVDAELC